MNRNLAQATVRESDDSPYLQFLNKNPFMNLDASYEEKIKVVLEGFCGNIILPTLVFAFNLWVLGHLPVERKLSILLKHCDPFYVLLLII